MSFEVTKTNIELFRPREIEIDPTKLRPEVGLFGSCGSPASTWRTEIFIPKLQRNSLEFYNPQVGPHEWTAKNAKEEAERLASDEIIVFPISKETHGFGSLAEAGWAALGALLRGQKLGVYLEEDKNLPKDVQRARRLFKNLAEELEKENTQFNFADTMEELLDWVVFHQQRQNVFRNARIEQTHTLKLPPAIKTNKCVSLFGTAGESSWREPFVRKLSRRKIPHFNPVKNNWSLEHLQTDQINHKLNDKVIIQVITGETEGFGSLAESGLLALSAFVRGQAYGLFIEDHPSEPHSDTNRTRTLVRAHINKLNEQFPGLIYLAKSKEELLDWSIKQIS